MKNCIDAKIEFSFKGQNYPLSATIDLDDIMESNGTIPAIHDILARQNEIDSYSYQYEMLLAEEIDYSNAKGLAAECMVDGRFDKRAFETRWKADKEFRLLQEIAEHHLKIADLNQVPDIKQALVAAFEAGKTTST